MDLRCGRCGEPWDMDTVLHEEPKAFPRRDGLILSCPACRKPSGELTPVTREQERLAEIAQALASVLGNDWDGIAAELQDAEDLYGL